MKKLFLAIALVAMTSAAMAQTSNSAAQREARQRAVVAKLTNAILTQNFTFTPYSFTPAYSSAILLNGGPINYVDVAPGNLSLMIPFTVGTPAPLPVIRQLLLESVSYTSTVKEVENGRYIVVIWLTNVSNVNVGPNMKLQNINLTLHFDISPSNGQTFLTISPDFSAASSYSGTVSAN